MKVEDTKIQTAGVMRCCLESVAREHLGSEVEEGTQSVCEHCGTPFRLVGIAWQPLWQLERA